MAAQVLLQIAFLLNVLLLLQLQKHMFSGLTNKTKWTRKMIDNTTHCFWNYPER